jgi:hypothetical protein
MRLALSSQLCETSAPPFFLRGNYLFLAAFFLAGFLEGFLRPPLPLPGSSPKRMVEGKVMLVSPFL